MAALCVSRMKKITISLIIGILLGAIPTAVYFSNYLQEYESALYASYYGTRLNDITITSPLTEEQKYCLELGLATQYIEEVEGYSSALEGKYRYSGLTNWMLESATQAIAGYKKDFVKKPNFQCKNT